MSNAWTGLILAASLLAVPAAARDRTAYQAIAAGDLSDAERMLIAERRIHPQRPELMLNLAAVYERTGRSANARALYREVLSRDAVALDMANGATMSSHDIANVGLARSSGAEIVTR